ncbi:MAG TPA: sigma-70 family RNA polymerase sigma factor [Humisphaera sp.]
MERITSDPATARFYDLVWPHAEVVLRTAKLICRSDAEAEDLAQETMFKAFKRIALLREDERVRPWLLAILRNTHIDRARVHKRNELSLDQLEFDPAESEMPEPNDPALHAADPDAAIGGLADRDVIRAVRKLPRDIRHTLLLVDVEGMQDAEAAAALSIPLGTVKSRLHRGRNMLREALYPVAREMRMVG